MSTTYTIQQLILTDDDNEPVRYVKKQFTIDKSLEEAVELARQGSLEIWKVREFGYNKKTNVKPRKHCFGRWDCIGRNNFAMAEFDLEFEGSRTGLFTPDGQIVKK
jgi:hypothetical protein